MSPRSPGPLCARCGCYRDEHRSECKHDWRIGYMECLTCSECAEYEPSSDEDTRQIEPE